MRNPLLLAVFLAVGSGIFLGRVSSDGPRDVLERIRSSDLVERQKACREICSEYSRRVDGLLEIAANDKSTEPGSPKLFCLRALGILRAASACEFLVKNIDYAPEMVDGDIPLGRFPCAEALVAIGNPSLAWTTSMLVTERYTERQLWIFSWVLRGIAGDDGGRLRIDQALQKRSTKNLELLSRLYEERALFKRFEKQR